MIVSDVVLDKMFVEAEKCFDKGEVPVSAAILNKKGNIVFLCGNSRQLHHSVIDHAEINCILDVEKLINDWRLDGYSLIVSLAPCDMCLEVIKECRLDHVYYILDRNSSNFNYVSSNIVSKLSVDSFYIDKFGKLLTSFFDNMRH